jgi:hypothetical protein
MYDMSACSFMYDLSAWRDPRVDLPLLPQFQLEIFIFILQRLFFVSAISGTHALIVYLRVLQNQKPGAVHSTANAGYLGYWNYTYFRNRYRLICGVI